MPQEKINGPENTSRLVSLDALRGLIVILMAVDHANHFIAHKHSTGEYWGGGFPVYPDAIAFLTRFITHPVAPGFFFLMGVGMFLFARSRRERGWSEWEIMRHFLIRGTFLVGLQFLVVNRAWVLGPGEFPPIYFGVLFALGEGMILGSLFLRLKPSYLIGLAIFLFVGTELLTPNPSQWGLIFDQPLGLLLVYSGGNQVIWVNYPVLPWLELVTFGMYFGSLLVKDSRKAFKRATQLGVGFILAFLAIRYLDSFGNIRPRAGDSWIDVLNVVKYPPAMTFTLLTMGFNLIVLGLFFQAREKIQPIIEKLVVFGRVPMFFYILHLYLYAYLGRWLTPEGTSIPAMYPYWLLGLVILYPLCRRYGDFKRRSAPNSLIRFL
ncbi:MAG: DUF1624 domain-containing protein [Chloroflexi bacterium]|nr:DUF1624 domain-containing protein [Chloroflexota bacterium]